MININRWYKSLKRKYLKIIYKFKFLSHILNIKLEKHGWVIIKINNVYMRYEFCQIVKLNWWRYFNYFVIVSNFYRYGKFQICFKCLLFINIKFILTKVFIIKSQHALIY